MIMSKQQKWTAFDHCDEYKLLLVRTPYLDKARNIANKLNFDYENGYYDEDRPGIAWGYLVDEYGDDCWRDYFDAPVEFDLAKIAECENVEIVDEKGNDIKGEYQVSKEKSTGALSTSVKGVGSAAINGVKLAAVGRANEAAYEYLKTALKRAGINDEVVNDPRFREAVMFLLPMVMHPIASSMEDRIPYANAIKDVCEASITEGTRRNADKVMVIASELFKIMYQAMNTPIPGMDIFADLAKSAESEVTRQRIEVNYDKYDVPGLKSIAKKRHIKVSSKTGRDELIEMLQEFDAEQEVLGVEDGAARMLAHS